MTEDEAKTKWCPFQRQSEQGVGGSYNRPTNGGFGCIASDCMAWRKLDQIGIGPNGEKRDRDLDGRTRWVDRGYCGLAGEERKR